MADPVTLAAAAATTMAVGSTAVSTVGAMAGEAQDSFAAESRIKMAKIQSDQTEASALDDLRRQVGNIKAIRASAGAQAGSPTTQAILDAERKASGINLDKKKASFKLEALQGKADKALYGDKAMLDLLGGGFKIGNSIASSGAWG